MREWRGRGSRMSSASARSIQFSSRNSIREVRKTRGWDRRARREGASRDRVCKREKFV